MRKPLSTVCLELARHAADANHELLAYILRMAAGEALVQQAEAPKAIDQFSGVFDWDVSRDRTYADLKGATTFSVDPLRAAKGLPIAAFIDAIHPDDVPDFNVALYEAVRKGGDFYREYRVIQGDRIRWISAQGHVTLDESRRPIRFPGIILDITNQRAIEQHARSKLVLN